MDKVSFTDLFKFMPKSKVKAGEGLSEGLYPFYTSSEKLSKRINEYKFDKESLIFGTGGSASIHFCNEPFSASTDCFVTQPNDNNINPKFYYYYLFGNIQILERGFKGAGLKHISKDYLSNLKLPFIPKEQQDNIVNILDKAHALIELDKKIIQKYDKLAQSVFLDMFGDPVSNPKNLDVVSLKDVCTKITDGTHYPPKFVPSGIPFLLISNIVNNKIKYKTNKFISDNEYEKLYKRTPIEIGDILYTTVGSYGNPAIVNSKKKFMFQRHIGYLKPNHDKINYKYLFGALLNYGTKRQVDRLVRGIAQKTLNLKDLNEVKILLPKIEIQNQFGFIFENIEKQKQLTEQSLKKSEALFQSLIQKAFKGELIKE